MPHGIEDVIRPPIPPLPQLESLSILGGRLDSSDFLASLPNLRKLRLECDFETFPVGFEKLDRLEEISIWGARSLLSLPEQLGRMPSLKKIRLDGCGVQHLPKSVTDREDLHVSMR